MDLEKTFDEKSSLKTHKDLGRSHHMVHPILTSPLALFQYFLVQLDRVTRRIKWAFYKLIRYPWNRDQFLAGTKGIYHEAAAGSGLTENELKDFNRKGWTGPFPLLTLRGAHTANRIFFRYFRDFIWSDEADPKDPNAFVKHPWAKSMHAYLPEFYDIITHPQIVEKVASVLGPDIAAWAISVNHYRPGDKHRWHVDSEHLRWKGVTVFLALNNILPNNTLKVIDGSQRVKGLPHEMGNLSDEGALRACLDQNKECKLTPVHLKDGEFFIFDGPLWHGSKNESFLTRGAMVLQYTTPDQKVEVPLNFTEPIVWHSSRPLCVMARGEDRFGVNRITGRPVKK